MRNALAKPLSGAVLSLALLIVGGCGSIETLPENAASKGYDTAEECILTEIEESLEMIIDALEDADPFEVEQSIEGISSELNYVDFDSREQMALAIFVALLEVDDAQYGLAETARELDTASSIARGATDAARDLCVGDAS